jgi:hypothetical protein
LRSTESVQAENLFLRRQLALFMTRGAAAAGDVYDGFRADRT